jgi:3-methyladenine DNA glycosylase AlkD
LAADDAAAVVRDLEERQSDAELIKVRNRLDGHEAAIGVRMRDLFAIAKAHANLDLVQVNRLLDHPAYEPRMAAICILDFKARGKLDEAARGDLYEVYFNRHDRITTWDMVDRSAPRVVGGHLLNRSKARLHDLAASPEPLRRRSAVTAPLFFVKAGSDDDVTAGFVLAAELAGDPEPVVHHAVGIFLKHAGARDPEALRRFLVKFATVMPRPALRLATEKLAHTERAVWLRS